MIGTARESTDPPQYRYPLFLRILHSQFFGTECRFASSHLGIFCLSPDQSGMRLFHNGPPLVLLLHFYPASSTVRSLLTSQYSGSALSSRTILVNLDLSTDHHFATLYANSRLHSVLQDEISILSCSTDV